MLRKVGQISLQLKPFILNISYMKLKPTPQKKHIKSRNHKKQKSTKSSGIFALNTQLLRAAYETPTQVVGDEASVPALTALVQKVQPFLGLLERWSDRQLDPGETAGSLVP